MTGQPGGASARPSRAAALADAWARPDPARSPALAEEYERLFVGPGPVPCPPYESYWREDVPSLLRGALMGPCTAELVVLYATLGLQVRRSAAELPDHVAVELEALSVAESRPDGAEVAAELVAGHLGVWLPVFCQAVLDAATHPHYRSLARTTSRWIAEATSSGEQGAQ